MIIISIDCYIREIILRIRVSKKNNNNNVEIISVDKIFSSNLGTVLIYYIRF